MTLLAWSFLVPILQAVCIKLFPAAFENPRHTFLVYETFFFVVAFCFRFLILPKRKMAEASRRFLNAVCGYGMLYYALWASADVVILSGSDAGFLLRVLPNQLYYSFFLPFVFWKAPKSL